MGSDYDGEFYRGLREASGYGATALVPLVLEWIAPMSVADVGCGTGSWLRVFRDAGVEDILGFDQSAVPIDRLEIDPSAFRATDLSRPLDVDTTFDLAVSLEVAEHLPESSADDFVRSLTRLAPSVLFSAAVPFQTGTGHINCRWPSYWAERFDAEGFEQFDVLRPRVWSDRRVPTYYRQNLMLYAHPERSAACAKLADAREGGDFRGADIVHPERWESIHDPDTVPLSLVAHVAPRAAVRAVQRAAGRLRRR